MSAYVEAGFSPAFDTFIEIFDKTHSVTNKAKALVTVEIKKFTNSEQSIFKKFAESFLFKNYSKLDSKTLILMLNKYSENITYEQTPLPWSQVKTLPDSYVKFE